MKKKLIGLILLFSVLGLVVFSSTTPVEANLCDIEHPEYCNPDGGDK